ncbi:MAG: hypothetical protein AAFQ82_09965 [Myxococcota bacterium]
MTERVADRRVAAGAAGLIALWAGLLAEPSGTSMADSVLLATMRLADTYSWTLSDESPSVVHRTLAYDVSVGVDGMAYSGVGPGASVIALPFWIVLGPALERLPAPTTVRVERFYRANARALGVEPASHFEALRVLQLALSWLLVVPLLGLSVYRTWLRWPDAGWGVVAAVLGTPLLYYAGFYSRGVLVTLLLWHAWLNLESNTRNSWTLGWAGFLLGLCLTVDYPSVLAVGATVLFVLWREGRKSVVPLVLPIAGAIGLLALYHTQCFGAPWETPYGNRFWPSDSGGALALRDFEQGQFSVFGLPSVRVALLLLIGTAKGLLFHAPAALFGAVGWAKCSDPRARFLLGVALIYLLFNAALGAHLPQEQAEVVWGGLPALWGPRHLLPVLPGLALGCTLWRGWSRAVAVCVSCVPNVLAAMFSHRLMVTPPFEEELQAPALFVLKQLVVHGPEVPLFASQSAALQLSLLGAALGITVWGIHSIRPRAKPHRK